MTNQNGDPIRPNKLQNESVAWIRPAIICEPFRYTISRKWSIIFLAFRFFHRNEFCFTFLSPLFLLRGSHVRRSQYNNTLTCVYAHWAIVVVDLTMRELSIGRWAFNEFAIHIHQVVQRYLCLLHVFDRLSSRRPYADYTTIMNALLFW